MLEKVNEILDYWFGGDKDAPLVQPELWWGKKPEHDAYITEKFTDIHRYAATGRLTDWLKSPLSCLAYIILLDQFSRVIYRDTKEAYEFDKLALEACNHGHEHKLDRELHPIERQFFYMPLEHSEDLHDQKLCVALMRQLADNARESYPAYQKDLDNAVHFAQLHLDIIQNFGRFPHRNDILERESTQEELVFLSQKNSRF